MKQSLLSWAISKAVWKKTIFSYLEKLYVVCTYNPVSYYYNYLIKYLLMWLSFGEVQGVVICLLFLQTFEIFFMTLKQHKRYKMFRPFLITEFPRDIFMLCVQNVGTCWNKQFFFSRAVLEIIKPKWRHQGMFSNKINFFTLPKLFNFLS